VAVKDGVPQPSSVVGIPPIVGFVVKIAVRRTAGAVSSTARGETVGKAGGLLER
jgi:hypothetical protein